MLLLLLACAGESPSDTAALPALRVVTFNTGTSEEMGHDDPPDDGYSGEHAAISDTWYGDGLAWLPAVEATRDWFAEQQPDLVVFQEVFYSGNCPDIPDTAHDDFVCSEWSEGDPTVAQVVLGEGYQVACHPGKDDKCAAIRRELGSFAGCDDDFCLEGLQGAGIEGCGSGARVARGRIELAADAPVPELTLVNVHGSSGFDSETEACRVAQVEQVFVDLDGEPAANGGLNLVMGDLNTDPYRLAGADPSADRWNDFVGEGLDFQWVTELGEDAPRSYADLLDIDHVASDGLTGDCWHAGLDDREPVIDAVYFDHKPVVCELR